MTNDIKIPRRILSSLMNSLSAGVVPRSGGGYIAIGRNDEVTALLSVLDNASDGGSGLKFIIGKYGSGKSFLISLLRAHAMERGFLVADCDLSPDRRFSGGNNVGLSTYRALIQTLSTKTSPDGGALGQVISRWLSNLQTEIAASGILPENPRFEREVAARVYSLSRELEGEVGGFDFARVIAVYYESDKNGNEEKKSACLRWLRGEYETKSAAKSALGVGMIIDDDNWFEFIKLFAILARKLGYAGFAVFFDECVNLYKITNRISRENNYEKLLSMFNDSLQGRSPGLALFFGGTPQFLEDPRRGLFSYEALRSRLSDGHYVGDGKYKNLMGPVIKLRSMASAELQALMLRVSLLYEQFHSLEKCPVTEEQMSRFLSLILSREGASANVTPREIIREYLSLLDVLLQNPDVTFDGLVGGAVEKVKPATASDEDDEFADMEI